MGALVQSMAGTGENMPWRDLDHQMDEIKKTLIEKDDSTKLDVFLWIASVLILIFVFVSYMGWI